MLTDDVPLLDQHCHGVRTEDSDRSEVERFLTESDRVHPDRSPFDSMLGVAVRRWCSPVLDLPPHVDPAEYVARRNELGWREVARRLLRASGTRTWWVDTGLPTPPVTGFAELAELGGGSAGEVVRLEAVAEEIAATGVPAAELPAAVEEEVRARAGSAVGLKSIAAYRGGLNLPARRPSPVRLSSAVSGWLGSEDRRVRHPDLVAWLAHLGVAIAAERGIPVQFHTGFGDPDLDLRHADPLLLSEFLKATVDSGATVVLLHCWPYHRNAAYLAHVFPHVLVDLGLTIPHTGFRGGAVLAETLEIAPWRAVCFSSDGYGLPELHHLGAVLWRAQFGRLLDRWLAEDLLSSREAEGLVAGIAAENAARARRLEGGPSPRGR